MKVLAYVTYEIQAEFDDDGRTDLMSQAVDAVRLEAPMGKIFDIEVEEIFD